mmetsp:Transcript_3557/g.5380  ORF Transcript_3557/g.5380 Transcript_3557/m.5380 type:complete len:220 (+) Transcript_3557:383-1042(+)
MYKSPEGPPLGPASPSPLTRNLFPFSTPGGIVTLICLVLETIPCPLQVPQYSSTFCPVPRHEGQVCWVWKLPKGVRVTCMVTPIPLQVPQVETLAPGLTPLPSQVSHFSKCLIRTFSSPPKMAVLKSMSKSNLKSSPATGPRVRAPCLPPWPPGLPPPPPPIPPPKKESKISPKSTSCPNPPGPPKGLPACWSEAADVPTPAAPYMSYFFLRSGLLRTS